MSKKRRREQPAVDTQLVEIYEDLANVDENIRHKAARTLLKKFEVATGDQLNEIVRRLFRGLCSGRKAARLGFSTALTECLTELLGRKDKDVPGFQSIPELIENLKSQTQVVGDASGQEERDHHFGHLFGAQSFIKSGILFHPSVEIETWDQLIGMIYELAERKAWLRAECGFILFNTVQSLGQAHCKHAQRIIDMLYTNSLCKTPEGVAIWIVAQSEGLPIQYPSGVWHRDNPLHHKEKATIAKLLKEGPVIEGAQSSAKAKVAHQDNWTTNLHFAWDVILSRLLQTPILQKKSKSRDLMGFAEFWEECVDKTLFSETSSEARKYRGFLLFQKILQEAPVAFVSSLFTQNLMRCLRNQLGSADRLLHQAAQKSATTLLARTSSDSASQVPILKALLAGPHGNLEFDKISKTKTVETLLSQVDHSNFSEFTAMYEELLFQPCAANKKEAASKRSIAADQLVSTMRSLQGNRKVTFPNAIEALFVHNIMALLGKCAYLDLQMLPSVGSSKPSPPIPQSSRENFKSRVSSCLLHLIAKDIDPAYFAHDLISTLRSYDENSKLATLLIEGDDFVMKVIAKAWSSSERLNLKAKQEESQSSRERFLRSIWLLYSMSILQIYNGESEAVEMLEELNNYVEGLLQGASFDKGSATVVEILLSFVSKPSQLFRQLGYRISTSCAWAIDETGLQSMIKVLETKETLAGQGEIFEQANEDGHDDDAEDEDDTSEASDVEEVDMAEAETGSSATDDDLDDDAPDELLDDIKDTGENDEELAAFDAKLAQALGTRPGNQDLDDAESDSSDSDMNDEQMEALDEHLEKVFRERNKVTSNKTEKKEAKETIVNFKCRVLELLEIYVRQRHTDISAFSILLPTLTLVRTTKSHLVSTRACGLMQKYSKVCRGKQLPKLESGSVPSIFDLLQDVHVELGKGSSNVHAGACSQASLLLARALVAHDGECMRRVEDIYGNTEKALPQSHNKGTTAFFTDWQDFKSSKVK